MTQKRIGQDVYNGFAEAHELMSATLELRSQYQTLKEVAEWHSTLTAEKLKEVSHCKKGHGLDRQALLVVLAAALIIEAYHDALLCEDQTGG